MTLAQLIIGDRDWLLPMACIFAVAATVLWQAYRKITVARRVRLAAAALKITGFALLAIFLVEPLWSGTRARPGANIFLLLVDNSQSLTICDAHQTESRGTQIKQLLEDEKADWRVRLEQDFDVRQYLVDSQLQRTDDFANLDFSGTSTSLSAVLKTVRERFRGRPLAGVLLLTDGNATDLDWTQFDPAGLPPVTPVLFGSDQPPRDIALENISVSQTSFEDAPVTIRADLTSSGYGQSDVVVQLVDAEGNTIREKTVSLANADNQSAASVRFKLRPSPGVSFYRLRVSAADEHDVAGRVDTATKITEATQVNNERLIKVDRGRGGHRVLYVTGRPNWEFKFLNRAVAADDQIELAALIRIARREAKFDFRGRAGESNNSLFRGFKPENDAETESYDQPVFVRLNMKDADELRNGFPQTEHDLYQFDAIIIDDLEAQFFTHDQLELLQRFVSERGGGLLMLGGQESYHKGGYGMTPVGDLLPVFLDRVPETRPGGQYRFTLTRDGWLQPWVRLRPNEAEELQRFEQMPKFHTLNLVGVVKPGAVVLAHASDEAGHQLPALVVQRYGRGRSAALTVGDLWRWQLKRDDVQDDDPAKAWRQMLRWLVADVPDRVELSVSPKTDIPGQAMELQVRVRDDKFQLLDNATVQLTITHPTGKKVVLPAEPSLEKPGLYRAVFIPREAGAFRVDVTATEADGKSIGAIDSGWVSDPAADEYQNVSINRELMEELAEKTGGEVLAAKDLYRFARSLPSRDVPITEPWTFPLWHQAWVMLMAVGCFVGEWGLRRWKGLP